MEEKNDLLFLSNAYFFSSVEKQRKHMNLLNPTLLKNANSCLDTIVELAAKYDALNSKRKKQSLSLWGAYMDFKTQELAARAMCASKTLEELCKYVPFLKTFKKFREITVKCIRLPKPISKKRALMLETDIKAMESAILLFGKTLRDLVQCCQENMLDLADWKIKPKLEIRAPCRSQYDCEVIEVD